MKKFKRARSVANGRRHVPGTMNKTEKAYAELLEQMQIDGEIVDWAFEPITLKIGNSVRYTPDFLVQMHDGTIELHEVKACRKGGKFLSTDDSWVKLKIANTMFAHLFRFVRAGALAKADGGGWKHEYLQKDAK